ncbi:hypothetical protein T484DRAFT_1906636, partial [Baffinella frigidus]
MMISNAEANLDAEAARGARLDRETHNLRAQVQEGFDLASKLEAEVLEANVQMQADHAALQTRVEDLHAELGEQTLLVGSLRAAWEAERTALGASGSVHLPMAQRGRTTATPSPATQQHLSPSPDTQHHSWGVFSVEEARVRPASEGHRPASGQTKNASGQEGPASGQENPASGLWERYRPASGDTSTPPLPMDGGLRAAGARPWRGSDTAPARRPRGFDHRGFDQQARPRTVSPPGQRALAGSERAKAQAGEDGNQPQSAPHARAAAWDELVRGVGHTFGGLFPVGVGEAGGLFPVGGARGVFPVGEHPPLLGVAAPDRLRARAGRREDSGWTGGGTAPRGRSVDFGSVDFGSVDFGGGKLTAEAGPSAGGGASGGAAGSSGGVL